MRRKIRLAVVREKIPGRDGGPASPMTVNRYVKNGKLPEPLPRAHEKEPREWFEDEVDLALGLVDPDDEAA